MFGGDCVAFVFTAGLIRSCQASVVAFSRGTSVLLHIVCGFIGFSDKCQQKLFHSIQDKRVKASGIYIFFIGIINYSTKYTVCMSKLVSTNCYCGIPVVYVGLFTVQRFLLQPEAFGSDKIICQKRFFPAHRFFFSSVQATDCI